MTAKELIEKLKDFPENTTVTFYDSENGLCEVLFVKPESAIQWKFEKRAKFLYDLEIDYRFRKDKTVLVRDFPIIMLDG